MLNKVFHLYTIYYTIFQQVMAQELEFGQVHTNNMTPHDEPTFLIGGVKGSGWGRNNALSGLREFSETRLITWSLEGSKFV
jgi:acyl-CoA reductase-like NAD-dependent aldehyde dehydrogenase